MFSGIIEAQSELLTLEPAPPSAKITLKKPENWNDLHVGDSIAVNGVCLTIEKFDQQQLQFSLGPETLRVTHWIDYLHVGKKMNLERSLEVGARLHGHFVQGHVDEMGKIESRQALGDALELWISFSPAFKKYIWKKGSVAVNGVSLTVNHVNENSFQVVLIPETLRQTNLAQIQVGEPICLEADFFARAVTETMSRREAEL